MENPNLIEMLKTFSKKEMKEFDKFLRSPYFTEGKNIRHKILYQYFCLLMRYYPQFSDSSFTKENIYSRLYPHSKYNDGIMRKLNSDLTRLAEKFMIQLELENDEYRRRQYLLSNLSPRKLDKAFIKKADDLYKYLDTDRFNLNYYSDKHLIDIIVNNFYVYRQELLHRYDFQKGADSFFMHFLSKSLEIYRNMSIDEALLKFKFKPHFMNEVLSYIKNNPEVIEGSPLIQIHYYELMVNLSGDETNYTRLKSLKDKYSDKMDIYGRYNIYINLSAFCYKKIRDGNITYRKEILLIDIEMLEKKIYAVSDYVSYLNFHSMVRNAAIIKEFRWANKFIDSYKDMLDPVHKDFAVNYAYADICFEQKKYNDALKYLSKISIEYDYEKQRVKNMILKIYYETGSFENAYSAIDTSRHLLRNESQITEARKKSFLNFLKFIQQLIDIKISRNKIKADELTQKIEKTEFFVNKDWLLKKLEELN